MRIIKFLVITGAVSLLMIGQARAAFYDIEYSDTAGDSLSGQIQVSGSVVVSGTISGMVFVNNALTSTTASVVPTTKNSGPGPYFDGTVYKVYGGTDFFPVNNAVYPGGSSLIDYNGGVAFNDSTFGVPGGAGLAFVLYSNSTGGGAGNYGIIFNGYGNQPWATHYDTGTLTLTAVPEPTTMIAGVCALGLLLLSTAARTRRP